MFNNHSVSLLTPMDFELLFTAIVISQVAYTKGRKEGGVGSVGGLCGWLVV